MRKGRISVKTPSLGDKFKNSLLLALRALPSLRAHKVIDLWAHFSPRAGKHPSSPGVDTFDILTFDVLIKNIYVIYKFDVSMLIRFEVIDN